MKRMKFRKIAAPTTKESSGNLGCKFSFLSLGDRHPGGHCNYRSGYSHVPSHFNDTVHDKEEDGTQLNCGLSILLYH